MSWIVYLLIFNTDTTIAHHRLPPRHSLDCHFQLWCDRLNHDSRCCCGSTWAAAYYPVTRPFPLFSWHDPIEFPRHDSRFRLKEGEKLFSAEFVTFFVLSTTTSRQRPWKVFMSFFLSFSLTSRSWRFDIGDSVLVSETLCTWAAHNPLVIQVELVAAQHDIGCLTVRMNFQLLHPALNFEKRSLVGDVEHQEEAHCIAKERCRERAKSFLTCLKEKKFSHQIK